MVLNEKHICVWMKSNVAPAVTVWESGSFFSLFSNLRMLLLLPLVIRANACYMFVWYLRSSHSKKCTHSTAPHHFIRASVIVSVCKARTAAAHHTTLHLCVYCDQHAIFCEMRMNCPAFVCFIHSFISFTNLFAHPSSHTPTPPASLTSSTASLDDCDPLMPMMMVVMVVNSEQWKTQETPWASIYIVSTR